MADKKQIFLIGAKVDSSFKAATKDVGSKIKSVAREIKNAKDEQGKLSHKIKEAKEAGQEITGLRRKYQRLEEQIESLESQHKKLNRTQERFGKGTKALATVGKAAAGVGIVTVAANTLHRVVFGLTDSVAQNLDHVEKWSEKLGIAKESFQELRGAANLSGIDPKNFDVGLQRFARRMAQFRDQNTGEAALAFEELGFSQVELQGKNLEQIFTMVAERMGSISDEQTKIRIAQKLFDSEGVAIGTNMFAGGAEGLAEMRKQFRETGYVFDKDATGKSAKYRDSLLLLQSSIKGITSELGIALMPAMTDAIKNVTVWIKDNRQQISDWIENFADLNNGALPEFMDKAEKVAETIMKIAEAIEWTVDKAGGFQRFGKFLEKVVNPIGAVSGGASLFSDDDESETQATKKRKTKPKALPLEIVPESPAERLSSLVNSGTGRQVVPLVKAIESNNSRKSHQVTFGNIEVKVEAKEGQTPKEVGEEVGKEIMAVMAEMSDRIPLFDLEPDAV